MKETVLEIKHDTKWGNFEVHIADRSLLIPAIIGSMSNGNFAADVTSALANFIAMADNPKEFLMDFGMAVFRIHKLMKEEERKNKAKEC